MAPEPGLAPPQEITNLLNLFIRGQLGAFEKTQEAPLPTNLVGPIGEGPLEIGDHLCRDGAMLRLGSGLEAALE
ncbi:MAG TPA: hypothetical protein VEK15_32900 [Vicinamibacteria bacterium]|nr:hypothetical protein [Vicinamibacteria bacterium]